MRKGLFNKICTLTVAVATMLMGYSCQQEEFIYTPEGACVTFQNVPVTNFELDGEDLQIQIMRGKGDTEETVAISLASGSIYTLENSSVTFAKNEFSKTIALSYDDENLEAFVEYPFELSFNSDLVSPSGKSTFKAVGMVPFSLDELEYEDYGIVNVECGMFGSSYIFEQKSTLQVAKYTKIYYRIKNLLGSGKDLDMTVTPDGSIEFTNVELSDPGALNKYDYEMYRFDTNVKLFPHATDAVEIPAEWLTDCLTLWFDSDDSSWGVRSYSEEGYPLCQDSYIQNYAIWSTPKAGLVTSDYYRPDNGTGDDGWWRIYFNVETVF